LEYLHSRKRNATENGEIAWGKHHSKYFSPMSIEKSPPEKWFAELVRMLRAVQKKLRFIKIVR
jgi:hypothetical protein